MTELLNRLVGRRPAIAHFMVDGATLQRTITIVTGLAAARGFIGAAPSRDVLLFPRERSIHMAFMRGALDVWFLRQGALGDYEVLEHLRVLPWSIATCSTADAVLEAWPNTLPPLARVTVTADA